MSKLSFVLDAGTSKHFVQEHLETYMYDIQKLEKPIEIYIASGQIEKANKV